MDEDPHPEVLDRLRESAETWLKTGQHGAMVEVAFLMAAADGTVSAIEAEQLSATLAMVMPGEGSLQSVRSVFRRVADGLQRDGWKGRVDKIAAVLTDPQGRRNAFRLAAGVSFIDGHVHEAEARLFDLLADAFDIGTDEASEILAEVRDEVFGPTLSAPAPIPSA